MKKHTNNEWDQMVSRIQERNLYAIGVRDEILRRHKHIAKWPLFIRDFINGPWANLIAQCEVSADRESVELSRQAYSTLNILTWSTHINRVGARRADLVGVIPVLVDRLKQGMRLIGLVEGDAYSELFFEHLRRLHTRIATEIKIALNACADVKSERFAALLATASHSIKVDFHQVKIDHPMFYHEQIWISPSEMSAGLATLQDGATLPIEPFTEQAGTQKSPKDVPAFLRSVSAELRPGDNGLSFFLYSDTGPQPQWRSVKLSWTNASEDKDPSLFGFHDTAGDLITMTGRQLKGLIERKTLVCIDSIMSDLI